MTEDSRSTRSETQHTIFMAKKIYDLASYLNSIGIKSLEYGWIATLDSGKVTAEEIRLLDKCFGPCKDQANNPSAVYWEIPESVLPGINEIDRRVRLEVYVTYPSPARRFIAKLLEDNK